MLRITSSDEARYRTGIDRAVYFLALIGLLVAVHLFIQQGRGFDRGCLGFSAPVATPSSGCSVVTQSGASTLFGVSNAIWGGAFYLVVALMTMAAASGLRTGLLKRLRFWVVSGGFAYSLYLFTYQFVAVGEVCVLCTVSAVIVALLFAVHLYARFGSGASSRTTASLMMRDVRLFALSLVAVLVLGGADLYYFNTLPGAEPAQEIASAPATAAGQSDLAPPSERPPAECSYTEDEMYDGYQELISFTDPVKGQAGAPVTVIEFFDPNCPHCKDIHPVMEEVIAETGDVAQFVFQPYPVFRYSGPQVLALEYAARNNKFFEMLDAQYELQQRGGLSRDQLRQIANEIGLDADDMLARMENEDFQDSVSEEFMKIRNETSISSVPAVMINGRIVESYSKTAECLEQLIDEAASS